ncbi:MAG: hypothetical protein Q7U53_14355, partial [Anaerolineaceae bacterium]|nr:hypothetical protein [Anaerolineaceae bacterium]
INWNSLISNTIWILALAWLLAVLSMAYWSAQTNNRKLIAELDRPERQMQLNLGGMLFCVGLALVSEQLWQMLILIALGILFLVQLVFAARALQR